MDSLDRMMPADVLVLIDNPKVTRATIASAYADLLEAWSQELGAVDVSALNHAIIARWSMSGLKWIKQRAWKLAYQAR